MNPRFELIPHKHVRFADSLLVLAGYIRPIILTPLTLDELWTRVNIAAQQEHWPFRMSFERLFMAVNVLFAIGVIDIAGGDTIRLYSAQEN